MNDRRQRALSKKMRLILCIGLLGLSGCFGRWSGGLGVGEAGPDAATLGEVLIFSERAAQFSPAENARERALLVSDDAGPGVQLRLAVLYGTPLESGDLGKGVSLLNAVLKTNTPEANRLQALAQLLLRQYQERLRLETQSERLVQQAKDNQRRVDALQSKLEALVGIEAALPARPQAGKPLGRSLR